MAQVVDFTCYRSGLFPECHRIFRFNLDSCGFKSGISIIAKFINYLVSALYAEFSCLAQVNTTCSRIFHENVKKSPVIISLGEIFLLLQAVGIFFYGCLVIFSQAVYISPVKPCIYEFRVQLNSPVIIFNGW